MKKASLLIATLAIAASSHAAIIGFDLIGTAGPGLLPGNEPGTITGGTGGEIGAGIFYDTTDVGANAGTLTLNIGWGSSQGFTNLSSTATNSHIHGPTANNFGNDGTGNFKQTAGTPFGSFGRSSSAITGGVITTGSATVLTVAQEADLFNGKYYINIHTMNNTGGELRGFLVPIPEPTSAVLLGAAGLVVLARRRRS